MVGLRIALLAATLGLAACAAPYVPGGYAQGGPDPYEEETKAFGTAVGTLRQSVGLLYADTRHDVVRASAIGRRADVMRGAAVLRLPQDCETGAAAPAGLDCVPLIVDARSRRAERMDNVLEREFLLRARTAMEALDHYTDALDELTDAADMQEITTQLTEACLALRPLADIVPLLAGSEAPVCDAGSIGGSMPQARLAALRAALHLADQAYIPGLAVFLGESLDGAARLRIQANQRIALGLAQPGAPLADRTGGRGTPPVSMDEYLSAFEAFRGAGAVITEMSRLQAPVATPRAVTVRGREYRVSNAVALALLDSHAALTRAVTNNQGQTPELATALQAFLGRVAALEDGLRRVHQE